MKSVAPVPRSRCVLAALGPLALLLAISHAVWGGGRPCYLFWKHWGALHPIVTDCARLVTDWGNPLAYVVYGLLLYRAVRRKNQDDLRFVLCYIGVQLAIALVLTNVLKNALGLPRPYVDAAEASPWSFKSMYQSFPSGHTTEIVGAVLPLALIRRRTDLAALCGLWIAAVGYSRVYLGRHYLMDVWGGMAVGGLAAFCILYFSGKNIMNVLSSLPHTPKPDQAANAGSETPPPPAPSTPPLPPGAPVAEPSMGTGERLFSLLAVAGLLVPLVIAAAQVCLGLDARSLWFSDEVRHGAVYEAMRQSGNWLILTLNGDPYPDKPPLYFWFLRLLDAIPQIDPPRLFLAANALSGLLFVGSGWLLARGLGHDKKTSLAASLVLLSTFSFLGITHYARMDLLFAACIVLAQVCLYRGWIKDSAPIWLLLGFVLAGLACLIKGPLGLALPLLTSLIFLIWRASFRRAGGRDGAFAFGIMLCILLAWVSLVLLQDGGREYLGSMFGRHMLERALDAWHHKQAWWFYLLNLPLAWLPWTLVIFFLPWERLPRLLKAAGPSRRETPGCGWTWISLISGLVLLSALSGKVAIYALPLLPFLAILTARGVLALTPRRSRAFFGLLSLLLLLLAVLFGLAGVYPHVRDMLPASIAPEKLLDMSQPAFAAALAYVLTLRGLPILAGVCVVFALILFRGTNRSRPAGPLLVLAIFFTVLAQPLAIFTAPSLDALMSPRPQADILRDYRDKGYHVTAFYVTSGTYTFYMGGPMDEINDWEDLRGRLDAHPRLVVATRLNRWKEWQQRTEFQPETFRVINTQWIAEREYVVLARDEVPAVAPVPAEPAPPAPVPAPDPSPDQGAQPEPETAPPAPAQQPPAESGSGDIPSPAPGAEPNAEPDATPPAPAAPPEQPEAETPAPPDPQYFLDGATPEVRQF